MKKLRFALAAACLLLPLLIRTVWFYQGAYIRSQPVQVPDYENQPIPLPTLSTPIVESAVQEEKTTVVFDLYHSNYVNLAELESLTQFITQKGGTLEIYDGSRLLSDQLRKATSLVTIAPTLLFSNDEITTIKEFVDQGGRLLVIADPTRNYDVYTADYYSYPSVYMASDIANLLLQPFGLSFQNDYVYNILSNEGNFRNVYFSIDKPDSTLLNGVKKVVFYGAHSLTQSSDALIRGDSSTYSSRNDKGGDLAVAALAYNERVLVLGDMNFMTSPYNQVNDNLKLVENIANFLTQNEKTKLVQNFPYLFDRPVTIQVNNEETLPASSLGVYQTLRQTLTAIGLEVSFAAEPEKDKDLILVGLFPPNDQLLPYLEGFPITFSEGEEGSDPYSYDEDFTPTPYEMMDFTPTPYEPYPTQPGLGLTPTPTPYLPETPAMSEDYFTPTPYYDEYWDYSTDYSASGSTATVEIEGMGKF